MENVSVFILVVFHVPVVPLAALGCQALDYLWLGCIWGIVKLEGVCSGFGHDDQALNLEELLEFALVDHV